MYLIDTNILSEIRKIDLGRANPNVAQWVRAQPASTLYLSVITLLEIERGIVKLGRTDEPQSGALARWRDTQVLPSFEGRILTINAEIAFRCAALHVPDPRPPHDALIAATALAHEMTVATRDTEDFAPMGVKLLNPWEPQ